MSAHFMHKLTPHTHTALKVDLDGILSHFPMYTYECIQTHTHTHSQVERPMLLMLLQLPSAGAHTEVCKAVKGKGPPTSFDGSRGSQ